MGISLSAYRAIKRIQGRRRPAPRQSTQDIARPSGPVLWLQLKWPQYWAVAEDIINRLSDQFPDLWFVITRDKPDLDLLPDNCFWYGNIKNTPSHANAFLEKWNPSLGLWIGADLAPSVIAEASDRKIPLTLIDEGTVLQTSKFWTRIPGILRSTLNGFQTIIAGNEIGAANLQRRGATAANVQVLGHMEHGHDILDFDEADYDEITSASSGRSIWFANDIVEKEFEEVIVAHVRAMRRSYRLLLIVSPFDLDTTNKFIRTIERHNLRYSKRSEEMVPNEGTQVFIADVPDEDGLWYRVAPICFMGCTLSGNGQVKHSPFQATALGSSLIHGPALATYKEDFDRLAKQDATILVRDTIDLAKAVETLMSPDKAAEKAHAAWIVSSEGAEVTDKVVDLLAAQIRALDPSQ